LMNAIESAAFADVSRAPEGGRGFEGVFVRARDYYNPFEEPLSQVQDDNARRDTAGATA
jgi:beta-lysine 5,6-aminomutase alpha subunit